MVDYYKIANDANYDKIMTQIGKANTTGFSWPQYQAFWINVYNFAVVRAVRSPCIPSQQLEATLESVKIGN